MNGFYKHEGGGHTWYVEVIAQPSKDTVDGLHYTPGGRCPTRSTGSASAFQAGPLDPDDWDTPYWLTVTREEAEAAVGNLAEQRAEFEHRQTPECRAWAAELSAALNKVRGLSVWARDGAVAITLPDGSEYTLYKGRDGKLGGDATGLPDCGW
jgi:hypothetical protein